MVLVPHFIHITDDFAADDDDEIDDDDDDDDDTDDFADVEDNQKPGGAPLVGVPGAIEEGAHVSLSSPSHIHHQYSCKVVLKRGQRNIS